MDANGARFWLLGEARHFPSRSALHWDETCRVLRLASQRTLTSSLTPAAAFTLAQTALERVPRAVDALEGVARWDAARSAVIATSHLPGDAVMLALVETPTDLCAAPDGVLYIALPGRVLMHDLRGRWADASVSLIGFEPWRLVPAASGGAWVLERNSGRVARLSGRPLRTQTPQPDAYDGRTFRPTPENRCPPQLRLLPTPTLAPIERVLALAGGADGVLALLSWRDGEGTACVRCWREAVPDGSMTGDLPRWTEPLQLTGASYAYAITWLEAGRLAVRVPGRRDAPAFDLSDEPAGSVAPLGDIYPLAGDNNGPPLEAPFANGVALPPHYPRGDAGTAPLHALSLNQLARRGEAGNAADPTAADTRHWLIDSGDNTTVWHRLFAEAHIPPHTGFVVWLAAGNQAQPPDWNAAQVDRVSWQPHGFGADIHQLDPAMRAPQLPHAVWESAASELAGHPGLLAGERQPGRRGLFSVLVQDSRQRVRQLVGRYLWVRVVLHGDGRASPELAALRAWGSRFSYAEQYLPRLYREQLYGDAAAAPGRRLGQIAATFAAELDVAGAADPLDLSAPLLTALALVDIEPGALARLTVERPGAAWLLQQDRQAWRLRVEADPLRPDQLEALAIGVYQPQATPADFNARMLASFEGVLTQLEDRVAAAHLLSDPEVVPEASLDWLGSWIGVAFDPALPAARRREWLRAAPELARWHGSLRGLRGALDVATGGAVRQGGVVVIEDFRLRRILATLLGVDLADEDDPLLPGLARSGNSIVGDTLVIGENESVELLALFNEAVASAREDAAVVAFQERLAHRATVLVHQEIEPQDLALIRRIVRLEAPAHVEVRVASATWPLLVGIASLVGVDTYLAPPRTPRPVQVQRSVLGMGDYLIGAPLLDPRLSGLAQPVPPPEAHAGPDRTVGSAASFVLDASDSTAAPGHQITEYRWRWLPPDAT